MLINEIQKQVLPILAQATVVPTGEVQQRAGAQLQLNPGQQVKAEIVANLPDHLYLARIAGEMFKLEIPINLQPGQTMEMTFVSADPKITFQLSRPEGGGESVALSSTGKWLSGVVREAPSLPLLQGTLLDSPAQGPAHLAARLRSALTQGGLFYESHLAQWAAGGLHLGELLKEPQGKLSRAALGDDGPDRTGEHEGAEFADSRTLPLVKEQLLLLNSGLLSWKGEAWPGQGMEIAISKRDAEEAEAEVEAALSLDLAHLGAVEAKLRFGADGLFVDFVCQRSGSSEFLKQGREELRSALAASGVHLTRMVAKDGEETE